LQAGDLLVSFDGAELPLDRVERQDRTIQVYNFEVQGLHNYFVTSEEVLVHNCATRIGSSNVPKGIAPAAEQVFEQAVVAEALGTGPEVIHGFRIFGNKGLVGTSYQRNIFLLEAEQVGTRSLRALVRAFEAEARAAGAVELRILGHAVVNEKLANPGLARRLGYSYRQINDSTIEIVKEFGH
jgi:hypothetical protein